MRHEKHTQIVVETIFNSAKGGIDVQKNIENYFVLKKQKGLTLT